MTTNTTKFIHIILLILIMALGAAFRFTGLTWDANSHLHPDERFLTMVTTNLTWPDGIRQYFDTSASPMNPHNRTFPFYVYGTYPVHLTKAIATILHKDTYTEVPIIGRILSIVSELFTMLFVFLIARHLTRQTAAGLIATFFYAVSVIPIQLSHFFTVDPFVTLFITASLWQLVRLRIGITLGIAMALAAAAKISASLILPLSALVMLAMWPMKRGANVGRARVAHLKNCILTCVGFLGTLRLFYPYLFVGFRINPKVLINWKQLASFDGPATSFPPSLQWINVPPWQHIPDLLVWGLGIPAGIIALAAVSYSLLSVWKSKRMHPTLIILGWIILLIAYQAFQFAKPVRYLWPAYPAIAILSGIFLHAALRAYMPLRTSGKTAAAVTVIAGILLVYPIAYLSVYRKENTRVAASRWMYANIPPGSVIAWEHWDDPLPFPIENVTPQQAFPQIQLTSYDPDDSAKLAKINATLSQADYLVLSSNRTYGGLYRAKSRYPIMNDFYRQLFSGKLGFTLVAQFTSRPRLPVPLVTYCVSIPGFTYGILSKPLEKCEEPGLTLVDDYADETFTVYDHAKVLIFKKNTHQ